MLDTTVDSLVPADIQSIADLAQISHFEVAVPIPAREPSHIHVPRPSRVVRARALRCGAAGKDLARAGD